MNKGSFFWTLLLMALAAFIAVFFTKRCSPASSVPVPEPDTVFISVSRLDTIYVPKLVKVSYPVIRTVTDTLIERIPVPQFVSVDTGRIVREYFAYKEYSDTQVVKNDQQIYGRVVINDALFMNKIVKRNLALRLDCPEVTKYVPVIEKKKYGKIGIGLQTGMQINGKPYFGAGVSYNFIRF